MKNAGCRIQAMIYPNNWEHISDELDRLDSLIHLQILIRRKYRTSASSLQMKGLVLEEDEITDLLADPYQPDSEFPQSQDPEIAQLKDRLDRLDSIIQERRKAGLKETGYLALASLSGLFQLTRFEEQCLMICLAPEIDRKYEKLYAYLQDDVTRKKPSVDLIFTLLCSTLEERIAARPVFDPRSPLIKYRLIEAVNEPEPSAALLSKTLRLDDRIAGFLLGFGLIDARLEHPAQLILPSADRCSSPHDDLRERMRNYINTHLSGARIDRRSILFYLWGPQESGKRSLVRSLCADLQIPLLSADMEKIPDLPLPDFGLLLGREALLQQGAICLDHYDRLMTGENSSSGNSGLFIENIVTFSRLIFITGARRPNRAGFPDRSSFIELEFPAPGIVERRGMWQQSFGLNNSISHEIDMDELAGKFRFTQGQVQHVLAVAADLAMWRSPDNALITEEDIHNASRLLSTGNLEPFAAKTIPKYTWSDMVLTRDMRTQLMEICSMVKYRQVVFGQWGYDDKFSLGKGINALFSGPSGTGKTMASEIIANELNLDMYKIDLSQVVSKYIGETEKNLHRIFEEAQMCNAILFFDEADALFGKRSEVRDAHDRYANMEIAYLLQQMEEYAGIVIMATNLRGNMDDAFARRMHFIVEFPFPDEPNREKIWRTVFPKSAPIAEDIDFPFLARQFRLSGGNIRNISLGSACLAAADGKTITMCHLIHSVRREYQKMGRLCVEGDFGKYYELLRRYEDAG
jgi:hypothetical protein